MCTNKNEVVLKLTEEQVDLMVKAIHNYDPSINVEDVTLKLNTNGLTINDAKSMENGELVFAFALRNKKDLGQLY